MTSPAAPPQYPIPSAPSPRPTNGLAIAALVVGIVAFLIGLAPFAGLAVGITAIVLGVIALRRIGGRILAIVGLVLGGLAALTSLITTIALVVGLGTSGSTAASGAVAGVVDEAGAPAASASASATPVAAAPAPTETEAPAPAPVETQDPEPEEEKPGAEYGGYPKTEADFVSIVEKAADDYAATSNELKAAKVLKRRDADACEAVGGKVKSWVGTIHSVGATGDGHGWVEIEIAPTIVVQTWNNAFSDIGDDTLIPQSAAYFDRLSDMDEGDQIVFSGKLVPDEDSCLRATNLTKTFNAADPNFLFRFSNIRAQ